MGVGMHYRKGNTTLRSRCSPKRGMFARRCWERMIWRLSLANKCLFWPLKTGVDHPSTLISIANLAATYRIQGRLSEAEELEVQVMEISKTKLGADHLF